MARYLSPMVLELRPEGLYCAAGDFFIDPHRAVPRAVITHAHADHARAGHGAYLCTAQTAALLRHRLGPDCRTQTLPYGAILAVGDAEIGLYPAGHILGSAQVRVTVKGQSWIVSGDYKLVDDGLSAPFDPQPCHGFITESTFGLPIFRWPDARAVAGEITDWWRAARANGKIACLGAYSLGKAQRLLALLPQDAGPILCHGAVARINEIYRACGVHLPPWAEWQGDAPEGSLIIAPPQALSGAMITRKGGVEMGFVSGWMALRGLRRRRAMGRGFVISDHADWPDLLTAIKATGAQELRVTHGYRDTLARYLRETGLDAHPLAADFGGDDVEGAA